MKLNLSLAFNSLSFGFCSYNILLEMYKRKIIPNIFPIGQPDLGAFDKITPEFKAYVEYGVNSARQNYSRALPGFSLWHCNGSEAAVSRDNYLFTFFELDSLTLTEVNTLNNQKKVFVSSNYTKQVFESFGVTVPVVFIPLGFDSEHFRQIHRQNYPSNVTVWSIFGKAEHRKRTVKTARLWLKKYGNNINHVLHLNIYNPFFKPEDNAQIINAITEGKQYHNINVLPYTKTLSEFNDSLNVTNIVIDMSGGEGFSLPSFSCTALGKHAIVHYCSSIKDWANESNAVLVKPTSKIEAYDGVFFHKGQPYNQGNIFDYSDEDFLTGLDTVLARKNADLINHEGLKLQQFTWSNTVDAILREMA